MIVLSFVVSCSEDEPSIQSLFKNSSSGCKLKKVIYSLDPEDYDVETYEYDSRGRLISIYVDYGQINYTRSFFYNEKSQLIETQQTSSMEGQEMRREITWNDGIPVLIESFYEGELGETWELEFNTQGITEMRMFDLSGDLRGTYRYYYQRGNLRKWYLGDRLMAEFTKYDSKHNPYRGLAYVHFMSPQYYSKNNIKSSTEGLGSTNTTTYTYNKNGYPTESIFNGNSEVKYEYVDCD